MGKKSGPKAPDPWETASAQGSWNSFTAQQNQAMNMVGQNSPWGSLTYNQTGTTTIIDPSGKPISVPQFTANTTLSPQQQAIFDQSQKAELGLAELANEQIGKVGNILDTPFEFDNQDAANWAYDLGAQRLDPRFAQEEEALRTRLANQGIRQGSSAYDSAMRSLSESKNDAYNQLMLQGRGQAFQEAAYTRTSPLNEIIGLMSGTQVQNPNSTFAATPQVGVGGVDYTGLVNQKYQADLQAHNSSMNALGGLFGLGAKLMFSDRRLKRDIRRIGTKNGLPWYRFNYIWDVENRAPREGFMSDEVRAKIPQAVVVDRVSGFDMVDYAVAMEA